MIIKCRYPSPKTQTIHLKQIVTIVLIQIKSIYILDIYIYRLYYTGNILYLHSMLHGFMKDTIIRYLFLSNYTIKVKTE